MSNKPRRPLLAPNVFIRFVFIRPYRFFFNVFFHYIMNVIYVTVKEISKRVMCRDFLGDGLCFDDLDVKGKRNQCLNLFPMKTYQGITPTKSRIPCLGTYLDSF